MFFGITVMQRKQAKQKKQYLEDKRAKRQEGVKARVRKGKCLFRVDTGW
jgi:hypothetical protein